MTSDDDEITIKKPRHMLTAQLNKPNLPPKPTPKKRGRTPIYDRAMTAAERKQRQRTPSKQ